MQFECPVWTRLLSIHSHLLNLSSVTDHDSGDSTLHFGVRVEGIDELMSNTKFSRQELQRMYRGFKNVGVMAALHVC